MISEKTISMHNFAVLIVLRCCYCVALFACLNGNGVISIFLITIVEVQMENGLIPTTHLCVCMRVCVLQHHICVLLPSK